MSAMQNAPNVIQLRQTQVEKQLLAHRHPHYKTDILLTEGAILKGFCVHPNVMRPEIMTSVFFARFLFFNNGMHAGKNVLDMGCGSGILGVVAALYGARHTTFSDISTEAIENSNENVQIFKIKPKSTVVQGNLFENANETYDLILFNHPFFDIPAQSEEVSKTMVQPQSLLSIFLQEAKARLSKNGSILMPFFHLAGNANNPQIQGPKYGYFVKEAFTMAATTGLQQGKISIYELIPSN